MKNFICDVCESSESPQSEQWDEMCMYCNERFLMANLDMIRNQIKKHEWRVIA